MTSDFEVGRYALRSFRFNANYEFSRTDAYRSSDEAMGMSYGEWRKKARRRAYKPRWESPSYAQPGDWRDGTCSAVCRRFKIVKHEAPNEDCTCGIYGSLSYADLLNSFRRESKVMVAVIAAEGTTIIGDRGLRTQFARVVGFWVDSTWLLSEWKAECQQTPSMVAVAARVAREQFKDAEEFGDPLSLVEKFGLALLPPASVKKSSGSYPEYWTAKFGAEDELGTDG